MDVHHLLKDLFCDTSPVHCPNLGQVSLELTMAVFSQLFPHEKGMVIHLVSRGFTMTPVLSKKPWTYGSLGTGFFPGFVDFGAPNP